MEKDLYFVIGGGSTRV